MSQANRWSVSYARSIVTGLRSLLRFLYFAGYIEVSLADTVPSVARWQLGSVRKPSARKPQHYRNGVEAQVDWYDADADIE